MILLFSPDRVPRIFANQITNLRRQEDNVSQLGTYSILIDRFIHSTILPKYCNYVFKYAYGLVYICFSNHECKQSQYRDLNEIYIDPETDAGSEFE